MRSLLPAVAEQLFRDVQKTYQETSQIPDELLIAGLSVGMIPVWVNMATSCLLLRKPLVYGLGITTLCLKFVFGPCALQALDLVDQRSVSCLSSPSGRKAYQEKA